MSAWLVVLAGLAGCVGVDRAALARDLYARSVAAASHGQRGRALGLLFALHSPQLATYRPRAADRLERELADRCAAGPPVTRWIEEPPVADEWYVWRFDGTYWLDELEGYRARYDSACPAPRGGTIGHVARRR